MKLVMVGCSHHRTPVELREKLAFTNEQAVRALSELTKLFPGTESVLLSTCNRVELYAASAEEDVKVPETKDLIGFLADFHKVNPDLLQSHLVHCDDREAVRHLFTVASSLDSMIVGEAQIIAQVKQAYELARTSDYTGPITHAVFQHASYVAKRVASETAIQRRRISVPSVAVSEVAAEFYERFDDKQITLIGAGEMGEETLRYLLDAGAKKVTIINRSTQRATELAQKLTGKVVPWDSLAEQLQEADLVVSTTGATEPVVDMEMFQTIWKRRRQRTMLILDLAVPRDFASEIGDIDDVYLYTVDDLQKVCDRNRSLREQEWPKAKKIIEEETDKFMNDLRYRSTGPVIQRLREQAESIKQAELSRLMGRLQNKAIDDAAKEEIKITIDRVVNKLLHPPLQSLRENEHPEQHATLIDALKRLFHLNE
jgi:glutamyl-tRNA reductase